MKLTWMATVFGGLVCIPAMFAQNPPSQAPTSPSTEGTFNAEGPIANTAILPNLPSVPPGPAALVGGTIDTIDHVRDELVLRVFGGGPMRILFDSRTQVYLDQGKPGNDRDLRNGQRIHVDVMQDGTAIFAHSIYVLGQTSVIQTFGQVESCREGELTIVAAPFDKRLKLLLSPNTVIRRKNLPSRISDISPGSVISAAFRPKGGDQVTALEISILARPGEAFQFFGQITHLDFSSKLLVLRDPRDQKTYEIYFDPSQVKGGKAAHEGASVAVSAVLDGVQYAARELFVVDTASLR